MITNTYQENLATGWSKIYNVPPNTLIAFKELQVGTECKPNSSFKTAIYWDQDGSGMNLEKIHQVYTKDKSYKVSLNNQQFTSTQNSRVIVRRHIFGDLGIRSTYVQWSAELE